MDPATFGVTGTSHYAEMVNETRRQRQLLDNVVADWIVLRNRLSTFGSSRNKRFVDEGLKELSRRLNFSYIDGLAERVIFRELFPRGLTAVDDLDEITLGTRPTMSHVTARLEMENLLTGIGVVACLLYTSNPVSLAEFNRIVEIWADACLQLSDRDLKVMQRLVGAQDRLLTTVKAAEKGFLDLLMLKSDWKLN